jgi:hypothetical protein
MAMDKVIRIVSRIQLIHRARVDRNFGQGRDAMFAQLQARFGKACIKDVSDVNNDFASSQKYLDELRTWVAPCRLPEDYVFFLKFCGGLLIKIPPYNCIVAGIGPMTEEWYGFIMGDDALCENGFLLVGTLAFKGEKLGQYVHFFLDLSGIIHQYCVIGMEAPKPTGASLVPILRNPHAHPGRWSKHGDSFTEWLERLAATEGAFGYD